MLLLRESIEAACRMKAGRRTDFRRASIDTTVQPGNVAFPTDAGLTLTALDHPVAQARAAGLALRQGYARKGRETFRDCVRPGRDRGAKRKSLNRLRTYPGRTIRDIRRRIGADGDLVDAFSHSLQIRERILTRRPNDGAGPHVHPFHAPEVECICKGKAGVPWEFGAKVPVSTTIDKSPGGQFITDVRSLPGKPCDGHTLSRVLPGIGRNTGVALRRVIVDREYRGHDAPEKYRARVVVAGQRAVTRTIRSQLKRRNAGGPVIGHAGNGHQMGCNYPAHARGDAVNAVPAAVGYNFHLPFRWARSGLFRGTGTVDGYRSASCPA